MGSWTLASQNVSVNVQHFLILTNQEKNNLRDIVVTGITSRLLTTDINSQYAYSNTKKRK